MKRGVNMEKEGTHIASYAFLYTGSAYNNTTNFDAWTEGYTYAISTVWNYKDAF